MLILLCFFCCCVHGGKQGNLIPPVRQPGASWNQQGRAEYEVAASDYLRSSMSERTNWIQYTDTDMLQIIRYILKYKILHILLKKVIYYSNIYIKGGDVCALSWEKRGDFSLECTSVGILSSVHPLLCNKRVSRWGFTWKCHSLITSL